MNMETVKYITVFCSIFNVQVGAMKILKIRDLNLRNISAVEILDTSFDVCVFYSSSTMKTMISINHNSHRSSNKM